MQLGDCYIDVPDVVEKLGIEIQTKTGEWLVGLCPLHDDNHRSFAVHEETGGWTCYAGCGKGGLTKLVALVMDVDEKQAYKALLDEGEHVGSDRLLDHLLREKRPAEAVDRTDLIYDRSKTHRYLLDRGFTMDTLKTWRTGWDADEKAVVIPAYSGDRVVGLIKRRIDPLPWQMKYDYTKHWKKSHYVFGLQEVVGDTVIIVEGPLDAMWLHQYGLPGVAILGSRLSNEQRDLILRKARRVLLAFDNDETGRKVRKQCEEVFARLGILVEHVRVPEVYHDIQECPEEVLFDIISSAAPVYSAAS